MFDEKYFSKLFREPSKEITLDSVIEGVNKRVKFQKIKNRIGGSFAVLLLMVGFWVYGLSLSQNQQYENFVASFNGKLGYLNEDSGFVDCLEDDAIFWGETVLAAGY